MEYPMELTGNEKKHDAVIIGMNGFSLVAGATAPWFIFPQLVPYYPCSEAPLHSWTSHHPRRIQRPLLLGPAPPHPRCPPREPGPRGP